MVAHVAADREEKRTPHYASAARVAAFPLSPPPPLSSTLQPCALGGGRAARPGERNASACFLSARTALAPGPALAGLSLSARCCYDARGALITAGPGGGHYMAAEAGGGGGGGAPLPSPDAAWLSVGLWYDLARLLCCGTAGGSRVNASGGSSCAGAPQVPSKEEGPAFSGASQALCDGLLNDTPPSTGGDGGNEGGGSWNDPHWTTLDGGTYTYNGLGAHLLAAGALPAAVGTLNGTALPVVGALNSSALAQALLSGSAEAGAGAWQAWVLLEALPGPRIGALPVGAPPPREDESSPLALAAAAGLACPGGPVAAVGVAARAGSGPRVEVRLPPAASGGRSLQVRALSLLALRPAPSPFSPRLAPCSLSSPDAPFSLSARRFWAACLVQPAASRTVQARRTTSSAAHQPPSECRPLPAATHSDSCHTLK